MKKKNGFTLIELLAVIVILAVIALIAVPQILKILNKARLNAAKDSTYGIIKAAETYATNFMLENNGSLPSEDIEFTCDGNNCNLKTALIGYNVTNLGKLDFKGTKPTTGTIRISNNGKNIVAENLQINGFNCNYPIDDKVSCENIDKGETPIPPTDLITPTAVSNPSGYSQSKEVAINFTGAGTYLIMSTKDVTTNVEAITCRNVIDASFTCDGDVINTNGTLMANTWYKVESKPTLTLEENGSIYYKVSDGTNYKDGGSITITEIDKTAPTEVDFTIISKTTDNIKIKASGVDNESGILGYQFSKDNGITWLPSIPQTSDEYVFNNLEAGVYNIKIRVINKTYENNKQNELNTTESTNTENINIYKITFDTNGGDATETSKKVLGGSTYGTLPIPTRDSYTFEGWYTDINGGEKVTEDTIISSNQTIYAHWKKEGGTSEEPPNEVGYTGVLKIVYLDPTDLNKGCTINDINSDTGTKTGCMKWYAYDEDDTTYTMILDHNTTATVAWNSSGNNNEMKEVATQLSNDTSGWDSSLNIRLITANEIVKITGNTSWTASSNFFFDTLTSNSTYEGKYGWLYDRTSNICQGFGCLNNGTGSAITHLTGYWTSSSHASVSSYAWCVFRNGSLTERGVISTNSGGVRPVITISKSYIS